MEKFTIYKPSFDKGVLLKAVKMNELINHAFELPNLLYAGYTDGIISGLDVTVDDENIVISKGLFCYNSEIYTLNKQIHIPYYPINQWQYLAITHLDSHVKLDGIDTHFEIGLRDTIPKSQEIELCRFKLQEGARLRYIYDDFEDMKTEFDTVNLLYAPYASKDIVGLHPKILRNYAREMLDLKPENILDTFFCMQVLGLNTVMNTEEVVRYLEIRAEEKIEQISNFKLYRQLLQILNEEKSKTKTVQKKVTQQRKIMI